MFGIIVEGTHHNVPFTVTSVILVWNFEQGNTFHWALKCLFTFSVSDRKRAKDSCGCKLENTINFKLHDRRELDMLVNSVGGVH